MTQYRRQQRNNGIAGMRRSQTFDVVRDYSRLQPSLERVSPKDIKVRVNQDSQDTTSKKVVFLFDHEE
jgi:hypothetical protein